MAIVCDALPRTCSWSSNSTQEHTDRKLRHDAIRAEIFHTRNPDVNRLCGRLDCNYLALSITDFLRHRRLHTQYDIISCDDCTRQEITEFMCDKQGVLTPRIKLETAPEVLQIDSESDVEASENSETQESPKSPSFSSVDYTDFVADSNFIQSIQILNQKTTATAPIRKPTSKVVRTMSSNYR